MTKVYLWPSPETHPAAHGIGRVVHAQYKYLPRLGVTLVGTPEQANVIASHTQQNAIPRLDVLHCHGLYWLGDVGSGEYSQWHTDANTRIAAAARRARAITVPSDWVALPFRRDMRVSPVIIGHGIEPDEWEPGLSAGYVLWNKNRGSDDVCDPSPAWELARRKVRVVSTFAPKGKAAPETMTITGVQSAERMRETIRGAAVYLATTKETFGIGTLEAMACGVPVLGYAWGGTRDIVRHELDGYLVQPGDGDGLMTGLDYIRRHREALSTNCRIRAREFTWEKAMRQYAELYARIAGEARAETHGVAIVITNHNYARYLAECIESVLAQSYKADEVIVVDDGSTDESESILARYKNRIKILRQSNQGVAAARNNGVAEAKAPYLVCLDADDMLAPRYVEVCRQAMMRDRGLGVAYTGMAWMRPGRQTTGNVWTGGFDWEWQASPVVPPNTTIPTAAMFRRSLWERCGGYRQRYAPGEDAEFYTRGLSVGFTAAQVTDSPWMIYRDHGDGAHKTRAYVPTDDFSPWMRDREYPLAAPSASAPPVRSYSDPRVSVIIPVGPGHATTLPLALDSLLGQTMRDWEVIVVNDAGIELDHVLKPYPFATYIANDAPDGPELGAGKARNVGLAHAHAPLAFFLDADDYLHRDALAHLCRAYANAGGRYVYPDWYEQDAQGTREQKSPDYHAGAWLDFSDLGGKHLTAVLMATEDARRVKFAEDLIVWEDWDFFARCALAGIQGQRVAEPLIVVRRTTGTRTAHAMRERESLLMKLKERFSGVDPMATKSCCGGNGDAIMAAKKAWDETPNAKTGLSLRITARGTTLNPSMSQTSGATAGAPAPTIQPVRLEFTGTRTGAVTYRGKAGRAYQGGNTTMHRYINAHPDDVAMLAATGHWRVVGVLSGDEPMPAPASVIASVPAPALEPAAPVQAIQTAEGVVKRARKGPTKIVKGTELRELPETPA